MNKIKMTTLILAASATLGGYGLLGASSPVVTNNIVLAGLTNSTSTSSISEMASGKGVITNGGSPLELLNSPSGNGILNVSIGEMTTLESGNINGYYKVEVHESKSKGYLNKLDSQEIYNCENSSLTSLNEEGYIINVSSHVNVRENAGINSSIVDTLANGQSVQIIGKQGEWYKVQVNRVTGFVYEEYISVSTAGDASVNKTTKELENVYTNKKESVIGSSSINKVENITGSTSTNKVENITGNASTNKVEGTTKSVSTNKVENTTGSTSVNKVENTTGNASTNKVENTTGNASTNKVENTTGSTSANKVENTTGNTSVSGITSVTAQKILEYAETFEGDPYKWGGESPTTGFDCSGFVQYVFEHFGISLPRTTYEQVNCGKEVSLSNIKPGNLVFEINTEKGPQHVGIYIGNGEIINAEGVGYGVTISKLYDVVTVRNVL